MKRYIIDLDQRAAHDVRKAGGKGASLALLKSRGFNVPPGFVITPLAFKTFVARHSIDIPLYSENLEMGKLEQVRAQIASRPIPAELIRPIAKAYHRLDGRVAVRSSMIGEDSAYASFAGQLDTVLQVKGLQQLLEAIQRCWASAFSDRFAHYAIKRLSSPTHLGEEDLALALVVQQMVAAESAGVAFSADPVTGQNAVVIEAVRGLADELVHGLAQPDRYVVDGRGVLAEFRPVNAAQPVLRTEQILALAELVRKVASAATTPQDVEWAHHRGSFNVLQARPISSLAGQRLYSNRLVADMCPGLVKPLVYSTNVLSMVHNVLGRIFGELIGAKDLDYTSLTTVIHSRIYTDLTTLGDSFERMGLPRNFFEVLAREEKAQRRAIRIAPKMLPIMFRLLRFICRHSRVAGEIRDFVGQHAQDMQQYRQTDWSTSPAAKLIEETERLMTLHGRTQWYVFIGPLNMTIRHRLMNRLVARYTTGVVPSDLTRGLLKRKSLAPSEGLRSLATQTRSMGTQTVNLLLTQRDATIRSELNTSQAGRTLVANVDRYLDEWGFLSTNGTDFSGLTWLENPTLVWRGIGRLATDREPPHAVKAEACRDAARKHARSQLNWFQRRVFDWLLSSTIEYVELRERVSRLMSEDSFSMRQLFLALANQLVVLGILEQAQDIFFLTHEEVKQIAGGKADAVQVQHLVTTRKDELEADSNMVLPDTLCGTRVPPQPITPSVFQEYLVGIGGSPGKARGYARLIWEPAEAPVALGHTDILVVPFTDISWTPLFPGIAGIVAETGGQLSHTSIVAREYGLPAIVSVKQAMHRISEGSPITIDGDRGIVYLGHPADPQGR
jgi:pyruvate,water dikinase